MSFLKKLFQGNKPTEPIFPGENFSIIKLSLPDGLAFATVNKAYENYPNKSFFPCWLDWKYKYSTKMKMDIQAIQKLLS